MSEDADSKMVKCNVCGNDHKEFLRLEFKDLEIAPYKNGIYYICVPCVLRSLGVKPEKSEGGYVLVGASEHEVQIIREQLAKQGIETTDPYDDGKLDLALQKAKDWDADKYEDAILKKSMAELKKANENTDALKKATEELEKE